MDPNLLTEYDTPEAAVDALKQHYRQAIELIQDAYTRYLSGEQPGDVSINGVYPQIVVEIPPEQSIQTSSLSLGRKAATLEHAATITRPDLFESYLLTQLRNITDQYDARIRIGRSTEVIPLTFALETTFNAGVGTSNQDLQHFFHTPNLMEINDDIADGRTILKRDGPFPLSLFSAARTDYSLHRLSHYTATEAEYFQPFVLFTNYQRYVDEFVEYAHAEIAAGRAVMLVEPGNRISRAGQPAQSPPLTKMPQMPAYHLVRENQKGDTLVNIGVGPSNAKTITDHIAVLRPHSWLMIGHCGALRRSQNLGDYVLAHAYLRDDGVLDDVLPTSIPIPTIAEVQVALSMAVQETTNCSAGELKQFLRTGTVVTTGDRNWELSFERIAERLNKARAIAIDMESATIAANGYRYRVPYGTLLCSSDKPLHGELKLPRMANEFYEQRVSQHLEIALRANSFLRNESQQGTLRSRKLRSFDEPLFR